MNDIIQWIIVGAAAAGALIYLIKRLAPSKSGPCDACPYARQCPQARGDSKDCPSPDRR